MLSDPLFLLTTVLVPIIETGTGVPTITDVHKNFFMAIPLMVPEAVMPDLFPALAALDRIFTSVLLLGAILLGRHGGVGLHS